jgi:hypothetical protein
MTMQQIMVNSILGLLADELLGTVVAITVQTVQAAFLFMHSNYSY